ncbi:MAG: carboxypeptidase regulatory-like domain-containing protein, partial [Natronomonas sp.]
MTQRGRLWDDTRGIEGLPVRLVIALVVGVASLSVMMNMISGISGLA